jgi:hypothetical protein
LTDERRSSRTYYVRSLRRADCDTVVKVRERLSVSKREAQNFGMERFDVKNLNDVVDRKVCQVKILNKLAALEKLDGDGVDIDGD